MRVDLWTKSSSRELRAGDRVEVRPSSEILATLDEDGCLDGVPFMPEMLQFIGRSFTVTAQVERACDTIGYTGVRRLRDTVLLDDLRCDGRGHDGCQAQCRLYWKAAWLRPAAGDGFHAVSGEALTRLEAVAAAGTMREVAEAPEAVYRCQATELLRGSEPVGWWSVPSLVHEVVSGNVRLWPFARGIFRIVVDEVARRLGLISSQPFREREKQRPVTATPSSREFKPGELVQVRARRDIAPTINAEGRNRGLWFDREMVPYCGHTARVKTKVGRFIDESTGRMVELKSDAYILDGVVCKSTRSDGRWFCPRGIYPWWRECWLEPVDEGSSTTDAYG